MLYFTATRRLACSCVSVFEDKCWLLVFYTFASLPSRLGTGHIYNWVFQMGSRILAHLLKSSYSIHCAANPISTVAIRCVQFKATRNAFSWHLQSITINYNQLQSITINYNQLQSITISNNHSYNYHQLSMLSILDIFWYDLWELSPHKA